MMQQAVFTQCVKCFDLQHEGYSSKDKQKLLMCSPTDTNQQAFHLLVSDKIKLTLTDNLTQCVCTGYILRVGHSLSLSTIHVLLISLNTSFEHVRCWWVNRMIKQTDIVPQFSCVTRYLAINGNYFIHLAKSRQVLIITHHHCTKGLACCSCNFDPIRSIEHMINL